MNPDAFALALLALADLSVLAHLRKRSALRVQQERMLVALKYAVWRANEGVDLVPFHHHLPQTENEPAAAA